MSSQYQSGFCPPPMLFPHHQRLEKEKGKNKRRALLWFIFRLKDRRRSRFCLLLASTLHFTLTSCFRKLQSFIIHESMKVLKIGLVARCAHGKSNATVHSAASFFCMKNVCSSLSTVWNYSPGWAEKRQPAKECHLDSTQCPLICHDFTAQHRHKLIFFLFFLFPFLFFCGRL